MPQSEFNIIEAYFTHQQVRRDDVTLGIGDDAAILTVPAQQQLLIAIDTLVSGVHFPSDTAAEDIAYKALAVNLSDMAAMGAEPVWFTLALSMPHADSQWLQGFTKGLFELAAQYQLQLIGGDTTQGPLTVSIQIAGYVPVGTALTRSSAKPGDGIYVTGCLGDAALGLRCLQRRDKYPADMSAIARLNRPQARVEIGLQLKEIASACIDISDGLIADLSHILKASHVGARLDRTLIPLSKSMQALCEADEQAYALALSGGDDYELCFCVAPDKEQKLNSILTDNAVGITRIGQIEAGSGLNLYAGDRPISMAQMSGYEHFSGE